MIILVAGLPGTGKTYLATRLASSFDAVHISSDAVRRSLGALGKYSADDKLAIYREMSRQADSILAQNRGVIVDATFYKKAMRDLFFQLASARSSPIFLIELRASEGLIKQRVGKPRSDSEADFAAYKTVSEQYEEIVRPHLVLESTEKNIGPMIRRAKEYISSSNERG